MGSYLDNLAARTLGVLDVVRPRRPSRYEPVVATDPASFVAPDVVDAFVRVEPGREPRAAPPAADAAGPRPPTPRPSPGSDGETAGSEADAPRHSEAAPRRRRDGMPRPPQVAPTAEDRVRHPTVRERAASPWIEPTQEVREGPEHEPGRPRRPAPTPPPAGRQSLESKPPLALTRPAATPRDGASPPSSVPAEDARRASEPLPPSPSEIEAHGPIATDAIRAIVRELAEARPDRDGPAPEERFTPATVEPAAAAPTITVTIGRIEVRALTRAQPGPPAVRPAPPRPRMTLDAFLAQRRRDRR